MRLLYRADGGHPIGTGHLFRAVRIVRELARMAPLEAHLVTADDPVVDKILAGECITLHRLPARTDLSAVKPLFAAESVLELLAAERFDLVAVDMLDTPEPDMRALAACGAPIVSFDDRGKGRRHTSALINVLVEEPSPSSLPPAIRLLQGGGYVALDRAFSVEHSQPRDRQFGKLDRVFVAMGGADAAGLTVKVACALLRVRELEEVEFVCGPAFPHRHELETVLHRATWHGKVADGYPSLIEPFHSCDLAIVAGGLTMYEVCCLGTPSLAVCQPIDHQLELSGRLSAAGAMATVGWGLDATEEQIADAVRRLAGDPDARRRMAEIGPTLVDGRGTMRVAQAFLDTPRK